MGVPPGWRGMDCGAQMIDKLVTSLVSDTRPALKSAALVANELSPLDSGTGHLTATAVGVVAGGSGGNFSTIHATQPTHHFHSQFPLPLSLRG